MKTHPGNYLALALAALALNLSVTQPAQAASWVTNGPMVTARYNHTATLLSNGKVLVAGGVTNYGTTIGTSSAELFDPATGRGTTTGAMTTSRYDHTATLLPNGKVLVAGGYGNDAPYYLSSADIYDPATGTWTATAPMNGAHENHTATLLRSGKVLVTGGADSEGDNLVSELYDPATGTWKASGTMKSAFWDHTATLLTNEMVLIAGGGNNYGPPSRAELYDPATETWTETGAMSTNRSSPTATLLPNGTVLVAGGWVMVQIQTNPPLYTSVSMLSAEIYDPTTGNWMTTTNTMTVGRDSQTASLLPNGQVLLAGGFESGPGQLSGVELYDPIIGAWIASTNALNTARWGHTATLLPGGRILVAGGMGSSGVTNSTEVYDYANGAWTNTGAMNAARSGHTTTLLPNGKALVAGGSSNGSGSGITNGAELYDSSSGTWTTTGALIIKRMYPTTTLLPNGKILITGGIDSSFNSIASSELYDPAAGTWAATGSLSTGRYAHTTTLLPNGKVLVAGGSGSAGYLSSAELYDPAIGTWTATGPLNNPRRYHTATLLPNGKVLVAGGGNITTNYLSSVELYDPAAGTWVSNSSLITARNSHTATLLPNGKVLVAAGSGSVGDLSSAENYDPATGTWMATGSLAASRYGHTATLLAGGVVLVAGGINKSAGTLSSAEHYDSTTGNWTAVPSLATGRSGHTATLLPNGKLLVAGGHFIGTLSAVELYDVGLGFTNSWRPQIATFTSPLNLGGNLVITGSQFRGVSGGSCGNSQDSPADYPLVQLRRLDNEQTMFLLTTNWSTNSFTSLPVWNFPAGYALATVFVNGIQSTSSVVNISVPVPTAATLTGPQKLTNGFRFAFTNSVGALFGVLTTTNLALPLSQWTALDGVMEISPGQFQFIDPQATNGGRFYRAFAP